MDHVKWDGFLDCWKLEFKDSIKNAYFFLQKLQDFAFGVG